jgi:hypothetical protein
VVFDKAKRVKIQRHVKVKPSEHIKIPLYHRGDFSIPPFGKGRSGGILT